MTSTIKSQFRLGILAYGSLIDHPGKELAPLIVGRIDCETPFKVEFARLSRSRNNAPTLIPVSNGGKCVKAVILILNETVTSEQAKSMLWRRELHIDDATRVYVRPKRPDNNNVLIEELSNFLDIERVLYTAIGSNITARITASLLADYAIASIMADAGSRGMDGVRYLLAAEKNGIQTEISEQYKAEILRRTNTTSLQEAIYVLDLNRSRPQNQAS